MSVVCLRIYSVIGSYGFRRRFSSLLLLCRRLVSCRHCPHSMPSRVYVRDGVRPSVHLSVPQQQTRCSRFAAVGPCGQEISIDRCRAGVRMQAVFSACQWRIHKGGGATGRSPPPPKRARTIFLNISENKLWDRKLSLIPFCRPPVMSNSRFEGFEDILTP